MDGRKFRDPERGYEYEYHFDSNGLSASIPARLGKPQFPLQLVLGSGKHAASFLTLISNELRQTEGIAHRVTVFSPRERLGLTPGHLGKSLVQELEHFGKVVSSGHDVSRCVECHTTTFRIVGKQLVDLIPNVTCESCHGPGAEHVTAVAAKGEKEVFDLKILACRTASEQVEMCGNCHRKVESLDGPPDKNDFKIIRFQPVGLSQSPCYQKSTGHLSCTTCHEPHEPPSENRPGYDLKCLKCHAPGNMSHVACRVSPREKCVECHMPRIQVHEGLILSDHWIRVRKPGELPALIPPPAVSPHGTK